MELINYDDLYKNAILDFSRQTGLPVYEETLEQPLSDLTSYLPYSESQSTLVQLTLLTDGTSQSTQSKPVSLNYSKFKGFELFNRLYDKIQAYNPDAAKYRSLLTNIASIESSFRPSVVNGIGAAGYFQFIDSTRTSIMRRLGKSTSKSYFLNNPEVQILAAIELAKEFERSFSNLDLLVARQKGHSLNGLISGAWLGGVGGVRKYLRTGRSSSDNLGASVAQRIKIGDLL